jgi:hypothetical protein
MTLSNFGFKFNVRRYGMEIAYQSALHLGRSGAVEELMGNLGQGPADIARHVTERRLTQASSGQSTHR